MNSAEQYRTLARLFLLELDAETCASLRQDARFNDSLPTDLGAARVEFTRLFTLSVYPYASVFLDDEVMMNSDSTAQVERFYEAVGFQLQREWMVGAADALGAEFACVAWLLEQDNDSAARDFLSRYLLPWAPVCCLAIERNADLEFYRALSRLAREFLLSEAEQRSEIEPDAVPNEAIDAEHDLQWVINYLLTPARSGIFLSKDDVRQIGFEFGIPLSFGERGLMLMSLLSGASLQECLADVLDALAQTVVPWLESYAEWRRENAHSCALWDVWSRRAQSTRKLVMEMRHTIIQAATQVELRT